jgi:glycosyltransferase involved in cell wall biosynthesis
MWGYKNIYLIPNGVDTNKFKPGKKDETFTVLFVSRLTYQKGFDIFAKLVEYLNKHKTNYNFLIVGNGPLNEH